MRMEGKKTNTDFCKICTSHFFPRKKAKENVDWLLHEKKMFPFLQVTHLLPLLIEKTTQKKLFFPSLFPYAQLCQEKVSL